MTESYPRASRLQPKAFTLIELIVVIGIIGLLLAIMLPSIARIRQYSLKLKCASQLRQVGNAMQMYVTAYNGVLSYSKTGTNWLTTVSGVTGLIDPQGTKPYWGVAYAPFLIPARTLMATDAQTSAIRQAAYGIWHCPSSNFNDPVLKLAPDEPVSYGVNGLVTNGISPRKWRRYVRYKSSSEVVFAQDSLKSVLNGNERDTLSDFDTGANLQDFREGGPYFSVIQPGINEFYRHRDECNVLWLDGHVSSIRRSFGTDVPFRWYAPPETYFP